MIVKLATVNPVRAKYLPAHFELLRGAQTVCLTARQFLSEVLCLVELRNAGGSLCNASIYSLSVRAPFPFVPPDFSVKGLSSSQLFELSKGRVMHEVLYSMSARDLENVLERLFSAASTVEISLTLPSAEYGTKRIVELAKVA